MKLSIVVPVFNMEAYIAHCLDSLLNQDLSRDEYEIIIVNDGSTDGSKKIAEDYRTRYNNINIINRENGGLSAARNTGLNHATGEYIWFVDSDDWIEKNCLKGIIKLMCNNSLDALCVGVKFYHNQSHIDYSVSPTRNENQIMSGSDFIIKVNAIPAAWAAVYRSEFLLKNRLCFYEGILHEDEEFTPRAYFLTKRIMYSHCHIYYYRQREGSIMKSDRDAKRAIDYLKIADSLYDFAVTNTISGTEQYYYFIRRINCQVVQSLFFNMKGTLPFDVYREKKYYPLMFSNLRCSLKEKFKYLLVNISPRFYCMTRKSMKGLI